MGSVLTFSTRNNPSPKYLLKLYISGSVEQSNRLVTSLRLICEQLGDRYELTVIDVLKEPELAERDRILATPTLIKHEPPPIKRIIGDLANTEKVLSQIKSDID